MRGAWTVACLALACGACGPSPAPSAAARIEGIAANTHPVSGDAQALGVLAAVDESEAALARQALGRQVDPHLAAFANTMLHHHQQALAQTRALGAATSERADDLLARGRATTAAVQLSDDTAASYRHAFFATAAADYADALAVVDRELLPVARTANTRAYLADARRRLAQRHALAEAALRQ